jgi:two-component system sensor kinase FixL
MLSTLGELTNSLAHEVKQPLSAILTDAQTSLRWLTREPPNLEKANQLAARIVASVEHASEIIERIREMAGKREASRARLDLNDVVGECLEFMRHGCEEKAVTIRVALRPDLPSVMGDRIQLQQVVVNLIVNSLQALRDVEIGGRMISLVTELDDHDRVLLNVWDTGPGIAEDRLPHVFESFFTTKPGGLGIGLTSCRAIVQAHGGQISAANAPDGGAEFRISIPSVLGSLAK